VVLPDPELILPRSLRTRLQPKAEANEVRAESRVVLKNFDKKKQKHAAAKLLKESQKKVFGNNWHSSYITNLKNTLVYRIT
jgi:hypothetical protein